MADSSTIKRHRFVRGLVGPTCLPRGERERSPQKFVFFLADKQQPAICPYILVNVEFTS